MIQQIEFSEEVNDIRSNIIEVLIRLFHQYEESGTEIHLRFENNNLHYVPGKGLWIDGCHDVIYVKEYSYSSVKLGEKIQSYHHLPYSWIRSLVGSDF